MLALVHTLPFLLLNSSDLKMAEECLKSLAAGHSAATLVLYNQGYLSNEELEEFLIRFPIKHVILGSGVNIGIPAARQACFEYIWGNIPEAKYISEIHVDMIFTKDWADTVIDFLEHSDEPMLAPGILTVYGELHPEKKGVKSLEVPVGYENVLELLPKLTKDETCEGFAHPVIHKAEALQAVGGYATRLLTGKQSYEDDSLLLSYRYYMGTRNNWRPKAYLKSRVYHISMAQRVFLDNIQEDFAKNLQGLIKQYGIYGLRQLALIHNNEMFNLLADYALTKLPK
ncbi:hypothetical protein JCM15765_14130 [Paradesulfitobacterium aromaticivorans]